MAATIKARRLGPGEAPLWRSAVAKLVPEQDRSGELVSIEEAQACLADERCYLIVAMAGETPLGLLSGYRLPDVECGGSLVYLYDIEVSADHRCQGIGKSLIQSLVALCDADEVDVIWAGTETANTAARRTFETTGARLEGDSYVEYEWHLED